MSSAKRIRSQVRWRLHFIYTDWRHFSLIAYYLASFCHNCVHLLAFALIFTIPVAILHKGLIFRASYFILPYNLGVFLECLCLLLQLKLTSLLVVVVKLCYFLVNCNSVVRIKVTNKFGPGAKLTQKLQLGSLWNIDWAIWVYRHNFIRYFWRGRLPLLIWAFFFIFIVRLSPRNFNFFLLNSLKIPFRRRGHNLKRNRLSNKFIQNCLFEFLLQISVSLSHNWLREVSFDSFC